MNFHKIFSLTKVIATLELSSRAIREFIIQCRHVFPTGGFSGAEVIQFTTPAEIPQNMHKLGL